MMSVHARVHLRIISPQASGFWVLNSFKLMPTREIWPSNNAILYTIQNVKNTGQASQVIGPNAPPLV